MATSDIDDDDDVTGDGDGVDRRGTTTTTTTTTNAKTTNAKTTNAIVPMSAMLPSSPVSIFVPNPDLAIAYDARTRNPLYVVERLMPTPRDGTTTTTKTTNKRNGMRFREEKTLSAYHRSRNSHYRNSGYDRGHLAPAADFPNSTMGNHDDENRCMMDDTFALTNVSPQVPRFNRTIWLRLEEFVRKEAGMTTGGEGADDDEEDKIRRRGETTYVITGPLWLPKYNHRSVPPATIDVTRTDTAIDDENDKNDMNDGGVGGSGGRGVFRYSYEGIGRPPSLIAVPTHFYKVVIVVNDEVASDHDDVTSNAAITPKKTSLRRFAAFVLPNSSDPVGDDYDTDGVPRRRGIRLVDHVVRLTDLEAVAGMEFFPTLFGKYVYDGTDDVPVMKEIADALTDEIIRLRGTKKNVDAEGREMVGGIDDGALVPLSKNGEAGSVVDAGRRRRIRRVLRDNSAIPFRHICRDNDGCFKFLRA